MNVHHHSDSQTSISSKQSQKDSEKKANVWHIIKTLLIFWSTSIAAEAEYRANFLVALFSSIGSASGAAFTMWIFYHHDAGFPGWEPENLIVVVGFFSIWTGVIATILSPNLSRIVTHVTEGTLEFVLLRPMDSQLQVSLRAMSPWGIPDMLFGSSLIMVGLYLSGTTASNLFLAIVPILSAAIILYSLWFMLATTAIWFTKIYNATEVLRGLMDAGRYPIQAFPMAMRFVFTWIVPIAFLTTVPAQFVLGRPQEEWFVIAPAMAIFTFICSRTLWFFALRSYTGASG